MEIQRWHKIQLIEVYNNCVPPLPLTTGNTGTEQHIHPPPLLLIGVELGTNESISSMSNG
jgi:hypothetical protein